jgi:pyruvate-formate lyase-activating enzyme
MQDLEFRQQVLDPISASFCAAKWYNATIWLGSGMTTSCHHPPAHRINEQEIKLYPSRIHNTAEKKQDRAQMQRGERPPGCEYCWKIEDMGRDAVSDRVYKSRIYTKEALDEASRMDPDRDVNLRTLEISFDRTCQLACSYCNPAFSSTWVRDIHRNGPYRNLVSDGRNHFTHEHASAQLYSINDENPYITAFFEWWEQDLHRTLDELRITGGEPLMSGYTWRLVDWFRSNPGRSHTRLAINSNLAMEWDTIQRLLDSCDGVELDLYTSNESVATHAEYIRDGLDWGQWVKNLEKTIKSNAVREVHVMCTINALCLESLPELLDYLVSLKKQHGKFGIRFTLNILRFPSFQSPLVLPQKFREYHRQRLVDFLDRYLGSDYLHEYEINHIMRLIDYLDIVKTPHADACDLPQLQNDFRNFYHQYDQRRNKNFAATFPNLSDWYNGLQLQQL